MNRWNNAVRGVSSTAVLFGLLGVFAGCEEEKPAAQKETAEAPKEVASAAEQANKLAAATVDQAKPAVEEKAVRPETIDTKLTDERRSAIEGAYADAKGFILATDIEESLKKNKGIKAKEAAIKAFDKSAKGKWILLSGPMVNLSDSSFELAVTYTPRAENDPMGMSRQFFMVNLSDVEGYEQDKFKPGSMVVVLAKYDGDGKASKGYELVETGKWK